VSNVDPAVMQSLSCAEVEAMLPLVADGALDAESDPQLFEHLAGCPRCQESLLADDLITLGLSTRRPSPPHRRTMGVYRLPLPLAAAAGLLVTVGLGALAWWCWPSRTTSVAPAPVASTAPAAQDEILQVLWVGPGNRQPVYLVRRNGRTIVVDPCQLDGAATGTASGVDATTVGMSNE
jgi:hypothetical protein